MQYVHEELRNRVPPTIIAFVWLGEVHQESMCEMCCVGRRVPMWLVDSDSSNGYTLLHCVCLGLPQIHYSCVVWNGMPTDHLIQIRSAHNG